MMTKEELKRQVLTEIDRSATWICETGDDIFRHPELGYKETRTSGVVKRAFQGLGFSPKDGLGITGVSARLETGRPGPNVCVMGELDAVVCPGHPFADPVTGAAHACGHNGQVASMLGVAAALVHSEAAQYLSGSVTFLGVPAEEYVEVEYRQRLRKQGKIKFLGGKQELLALGFFDDVDMAMMVHMGSSVDGRKVTVGGTSNGFVGKLVRFKGKEAHAGGAPHRGINALNAANIALVAINAQRETFKDEDHIRVHPIITKGGDLVNVIPADVRMETYVRGKTMESILDANEKVNRALKAGAYAVGAAVEIDEIPGYLPRKGCEALDEVFFVNAAEVAGEQAVVRGSHGSGSSDMGDLMHVMPAIHPSCGGAKGAAHSEEFLIDDASSAYVLPAKLMAMTVVDVLWDDASLARKIKSEFKPPMTKDEYFAMWEKALEGSLR